MKRDIATGKTVSRTQHESSKKVTIFFEDMTKEEMDLHQYKLRIKEIRE